MLWSEHKFRNLAALVRSSDVNLEMAKWVLCYGKKQSVVAREYGVSRQQVNYTVSRLKEKADCYIEPPKFPSAEDVALEVVRLLKVEK